MRPAVELPLDRGAEVTTHGLGSQQAVHCGRNDLAVVIPSAAEIDQHVAIFRVVTDPLNEAASGNGVTLERIEAYQPSILYIDGFCSCSDGETRGEERQADEG